MGGMIPALKIQKNEATEKKEKGNRKGQIG